MDRQPPLWEEVLNAIHNGQQPAEAQWQALTSDERELITTLQKEDLTAKAAVFLDRIAEDSAWQKLSGNIQKEDTPRRTISMRLLRYAAVFAGALVLGSGALFLLRKNDPSRPVIAGTYITPPANHKRATLVLDDGRSIELDKRPDSRIRQGQAEVVNVDTALLRYTAENGAIKPAGFNTLIIPRGGEYKIELADGSEVWLNAETQLRYPAHFGGVANRVVYLESGEAYFKVRPDARQPFVVVAGGMDIHVLGTEFNINTYSRAIATTLVNGSVRLNAGAAVTMLQPDQQAVYDKGDFSRKEVDVETYIAWKEGQMIFAEATLEDVMIVIGRQYDFKVEFASSQLKDRQFGGRLRRSQHIEDVLAVIGKVGGVQFSIRGKTIFVDKALSR
jgi:ferric-dicitrate binding protein FerR (iron transport regulator)